MIKIEKNQNNLTPILIATTIISALIASGELVPTKTIFAADKTGSVRTGTQVLDSLIQSEGAYAYKDEDGNRIIYLTAEDIHTIASNFDNIQASIAGNYNSSVTYKEGDYCFYKGSIYKCIKQTVGNDPTNPTYWKETTVTKEYASVQHDIEKLKQTVTDEVAQQLVDLAGNFAGIYDTTVSVTYQPGQLVMFDNTLYKCVTQTTSGGQTPNTNNAWVRTTVAEQVSVMGNWVAGGKYNMATTIATKNGTDLRGKFSKDSAGNYNTTATFEEINKAIASIPTGVTLNEIQNGNLILTYHYHVNSDTGDTTNANDPSRNTAESSSTKGGCYQTPHYYYKITRSVPGYSYVTGYTAVYSQTTQAVYHAGYTDRHGDCHPYSAWGYHEYYATHYYDTDYSSCTVYYTYHAGYTSYVTTYFVSGYTPNMQTQAAYVDISYGNGYSVPATSTDTVTFPAPNNGTSSVTATTVYTTDQILYELACGRQDGEIVQADISY